MALGPPEMRLNVFRLGGGQSPTCSRTRQDGYALPAG